MTVDLVVTRHPGLVEFLRKKGIVGENVRVIPHATAADVEGRNVAGVLPLYLASVANTVTEVELNLPLEMRGKELSTEEVERYATGIVTYSVRVLERTSL